MKYCCILFILFSYLFIYDVTVADDSNTYVKTPDQASSIEKPKISQEDQKQDLKNSEVKIVDGKPESAADLIECKLNNQTTCPDDGVLNTQTYTHMFNENKQMLARTVYVIVGITLCVVAYFGIKSFR